MTDYSLEEVLTIIEENGQGREVFMSLFRDPLFIADELTADDCAEVFEGILKGKDDLTKERLKNLCATYDADLEEIVNGITNAAEKVEQEEGKDKMKLETTTEKPKRFRGRIFRFRKNFPVGTNIFDPKVFILKGMEEGVERWEEIDRNLFIDLKAMTDEDHVRTTFNDGVIWDIEIRTDARRERMFTTIAKHCYDVEL